MISFWRSIGNLFDASVSLLIILSKIDSFQIPVCLLSAVCCSLFLVELERIELSASGVQNQRSSQLSYSPTSSNSTLRRLSFLRCKRMLPYLFILHTGQRQVRFHLRNRPGKLFGEG